MHPLAYYICLRILCSSSRRIDGMFKKHCLKVVASKFFSLSNMQRFGLGYLDNQHFSIFCATCSAVLFCILISSTRFVTGSIHVSASNTNIRFFTLIFHGPMRSTATSSHGATNAFRGGKCPNCLPNCLYCWQFLLHLNSLHNTDKFGE